LFLKLRVVFLPSSEVCGKTGFHLAFIVTPPFTAEQKSVKIEHIGKEATRLEDQWYLGHNPEAQTVYRLPKKDFKNLAAVTIREARKFRQIELARASGYSSREVSRLISGNVAATPEAITRLQAAINM
jgi:hypothetical protein